MTTSFNTPIRHPPPKWQSGRRSENHSKSTVKSSSKTPRARTLRTAKTSQKCWKMLSSQRKVNRVQVRPRVRQVTSQYRPQEEQKPLLRKLRQFQTPLTHDQVQARTPLRLPPKTPPRLPLKTPPRLPPKTLTKKPQFLLHMLKLTKQQAKHG